MSSKNYGSIRNSKSERVALLEESSKIAHENEELGIVRFLLFIVVKEYQVIAY